VVSASHEIAAGPERIFELIADRRADRYGPGRSSVGLRDFVVEMPGGHRLALGERIIQSR
jgi:hypothetical protein